MTPPVNGRAAVRRIVSDRTQEWWHRHVGLPDPSAGLLRWAQEPREGPMSFPEAGDDIVTVRLRGPIVSASSQRWMEEFGEEAVSGASFAEEIAPAIAEQKPVLVVIDSPGGRVDQAARIRTEIIRARQAGVPRIDALVEGASWSAATVIMALCDEVAIERVATVMIHQVRMLVYGTAKTLRDSADAVESMSRASAMAYAPRIGEQTARELMDSDMDHWFSASQAVELGLCDLIFEAESAGARDPDDPPTPAADPDPEPGTDRADPEDSDMAAAAATTQTPWTRPDGVVPTITLGIGDQPA